MFVQEILFILSCRLLFLTSEDTTSWNFPLKLRVPDANVEIQGNKENNNNNKGGCFLSHFSFNPLLIHSLLESLFIRGRTSWKNDLLNRSHYFYHNKFKKEGKGLFFLEAKSEMAMEAERHAKGQKGAVLQRAKWNPAGHQFSHILVPCKSKSKLLFCCSV